MKFVYNHKPIAKQRHRSTRTGHTYDPQHAQKMETKKDSVAQMFENGFKSLKNESLMLSATICREMPKSWSKAKKNALKGKPCDKKPDLDNYLKYYSDVLNTVAYDDDSQIASITACKIWDDKNLVTLNLTPIGGDMIVEHAKTIHKEISMADLEAMVKKAHRLGITGRNLVNIFSQEDSEGKHIYFECEALKPHGGSNGDV